MEKLFRSFEQRRRAGESFLEYSRRYEIDDLKIQSGMKETSS
jgi:hypothetical protein